MDIKIINPISINNIRFNNGMSRRGEETSPQDSGTTNPVSFVSVKNYADINFKARIHDYACHGNWNGIRAELDKGVDVNLQNEDGDTILILACLNKHKDVVKNLCKVPGINVNMQNHRGNSAFIATCIVGNKDIAELLLQERSDINIDLKNKSNNKAISYCGMEIANMINEYKNKIAKENKKIREQLLSGNIHFNNELWTDNEKQSLQQMFLENNYAGIMQLYKTKAAELNNEHKRYQEQLKTLKGEVEKTVREETTNKIREEERTAAEKRLNEKRVTAEREINALHEKSEKDIENMRTQAENALNTRRQEIANAEKALEEQKANLNSIIDTKVAEILSKEREALEQEYKAKLANAETEFSIRKKTFDEKEKAVLAQEKSNKDKEAQLDKREKDLGNKEAAVHKKGLALDNLTSNTQTYIKNAIINDRNEIVLGIKTQYNIKDEELPKEIGYGAQVVYVLNILLQRKDRLTDTDNDTPDKITKELQDENKNISKDGLMFLERVIDESRKKCSEKDLLAAIRAVKGDFGLLDMEKVALFHSYLAWGDNTIGSTIKKLAQYAKK